MITCFSDKQYSWRWAVRIRELPNCLRVHCIAIALLHLLRRSAVRTRFTTANCLTVCTILALSFMRRTIARLSGLWCVNAGQNRELGKSGGRQRGVVGSPILSNCYCSRGTLAVSAKRGPPPVGLEPTTTGLKGQRSTD